MSTPGFVAESAFFRGINTVTRSTSAKHMLRPHERVPDWRFSSVGGIPRKFVFLRGGCRRTLGEFLGLLCS